MTGFGLRRSASWAALLAFFTSLTACGGGQESAPPPTTLVPTTLVPTTVVPTTAPAPTLPAQPPEQLSKQQMRELVAPVALHPAASVTCSGYVVAGSSDASTTSG